MAQIHPLPDPKEHWNEEDYLKEFIRQADPLGCKLNSPPMNAPLKTPEKANVAIVAKTPKELLPTQNVVSSLHVYSSNSESVKVNVSISRPPAAAATTTPPRRSKLENRRLVLAQQLSKGEITPEEYERGMCLLWDRPKLSAEGDWVSISAKSSESNGGRCVLL